MRYIFILLLIPIYTLSQQDTLKFLEGHVAIGKVQHEAIKVLYLDNKLYGKDSLVYWNKVGVLKAKELPRHAIYSIPSKNGIEVYLDTVVKMDSSSANQLYNSAKLWISENFKSSKAVIDLDNKEEGIIIGKGNQELFITNSLDLPVQTRCSFTFKIRVKDNKYRLELFDLSYKPDNGTYFSGIYSSPVTTYPRDWFLPSITKGFPVIKESYRAETLKLLDSMFISLYSAMSSSSNKDDW